MLGVEEMIELVKKLLGKGEFPVLEPAYFSTFNPESGHGVLSLLIKEFSTQLIGKNSKGKRVVCSRFFKAIKHCVLHGATMQHPTFFCQCSL